MNINLITTDKNSLLPNFVDVLVLMCTVPVKLTSGLFF